MNSHHILDTHKVRDIDYQRGLAIGGTRQRGAVTREDFRVSPWLLWLGAAAGIAVIVIIVIIRHFI
jgi:hypothetical protein